MFDAGWMPPRLPTWSGGSHAEHRITPSSAHRRQSRESDNNDDDEDSVDDESDTTDESDDTDEEYEYKEIHVLCIIWEEDDLGVKQETRRFGNLFQDEFGVTSSIIYRITSINSYVKLEKLLGRYKDLLSHPDNLLVIYYSGHGFLDKSQRMMLAAWK